MENPFRKIEREAERDPLESQTLAERVKAERKMEALRGKVIELSELDIKQAEGLLEMIKDLPEKDREEKFKRIAPNSMKVLEETEDVLSLSESDIRQGLSLVDRFSEMSVEEIERRLEILRQLEADAKEDEEIKTAS